MRFSVAHPLELLVAVCLISAVPASVFADTIYLKSGRKIVASHVTEANGQVSYDTPNGQFSFPLSIVDHIERDAPPSSSAAGTSGDKAFNLPITAPSVMSAAP